MRYDPTIATGEGLVLSRLRCYLLCLIVIPAGLAADPDSAAAKDQENNAFPPGMIAMFASSTCPDGWTDEPLTQGRIPMGAAASAEIGDTTGDPIVNKQPLPHLHTYSTSHDLTGSNMTLGRNFLLRWLYAQVLEFKGESMERDTNLPFFAVPMCRPSVQP